MIDRFGLKLDAQSNYVALLNLPSLPIYIASKLSKDYFYLVNKREGLLKVINGEHDSCEENIGEEYGYLSVGKDKTELIWKHPWEDDGMAEVASRGYINTSDLIMLYDAKISHIEENNWTASRSRMFENYKKINNLELSGYDLEVRKFENQFALYFNEKKKKNKFNHPIIQNKVTHKNDSSTVETMVSRKPESSFKWNLVELELFYEFLVEEIPKTYESE